MTAPWLAAATAALAVAAWTGWAATAAETFPARGPRGLRGAPSARPAPAVWSALRALPPVAPRRRPRPELVADLHRAGLDPALAGELAAREPLLAALGAVLSGLLAIGLVPGAPGAWAAALAAGALAPSAWLRAAVRRTAAARQRRLLEQLPDLVELLVLALQAGLPARQALEVAVGHAPPEWRAVLALALGRSQQGLALELAFSPAREQLDPGPCRAVLGALAAADRAGVGQVEALRRQAAFARALAYRRWQAAVNALPVRLMLIGIVLLFPPVLVVLLLPNILAFIAGW